MNIVAEKTIIKKKPITLHQDNRKDGWKSSQN